jgi:hypothetical protein
MWMILFTRPICRRRRFGQDILLVGMHSGSKTIFLEAPPTFFTEALIMETFFA